MACESVATTSANIVVKLSFEEMEAILRRALGDQVVAVQTQAEARYTNWNDGQLPAGTHTKAFAKLSNGDRVILVQTQTADGIKHTFQFDNGSQIGGRERLEAFQTATLPALNKALSVGNQRAVLSRIAQLGKLSNVQQKSAGVTARVSITL